MKNSRDSFSFGTLASLLGFLAVAIIGCVGNAARENVTLPAMRAAWDAIKVEAMREVTVTGNTIGQEAVTTADTAMASGDAVKIIAAPWLMVHDLAESDIARRRATNEIGAGAAASLREELRLFTISRNTYTRTPQ